MMTEAQRYELGAYVNLMLSSTQLLINPIIGLLPKFSMEDFEGFKSWKDRKAKRVFVRCIGTSLFHLLTFCTRLI